LRAVPELACLSATGACSSLRSLGSPARPSGLPGERTGTQRSPALNQASRGCQSTRCPSSLECHWGLLVPALARESGRPPADSPASAPAHNFHRHSIKRAGAAVARGARARLLECPWDLLVPALARESGRLPADSLASAPARNFHQHSFKRAGAAIARAARARWLECLWGLPVPALARESGRPSQEPPLLHSFRRVKRMQSSPSGQRGQQSASRGRPLRALGTPTDGRIRSGRRRQGAHDSTPSLLPLSGRNGR